jgi:putative AbiEi antitoxin of type IV toxin-antitoxin system
MHHSGPLHSLATVAADQHGIVTSSQIRTGGLTQKQLRRHLAEGALERAGSHVFRSPFTEPSLLAELAALVLDCGEGAVASGPTAAALHELDGFGLLPPYHVTVPRGRFVDRPPHFIHTSNELPPVDRTLRHGIPVFSVPRTLIDNARFARAAALSIALDGALRDRKVTEDLLHLRIAAIRCRGRHGIPMLIDVIEGAEAARGGHSWLERRFLEICAAAQMPKPACQQVVTDSKGKMVRVDFTFPGTRVVVEVLGYRWHRGSRQQFSRDAERLNALVRGGRLPLQFTYEHVTLESAWVVSEVRGMLALDSVSAGAPAAVVHPDTDGQGPAAIR